MAEPIKNEESSLYQRCNFQETTYFKSVDALTIIEVLIKEVENLPTEMKRATEYYEHAEPDEREGKHPYFDAEEKIDQLTMKLKEAKKEIQILRICGD